MPIFLFSRLLRISVFSLKVLLILLLQQDIALCWYSCVYRVAIFSHSGSVASDVVATASRLTFFVHDFFQCQLLCIAKPAITTTTTLIDISYVWYRTRNVYTHNRPRPYVVPQQVGSQYKTSQVNNKTTMRFAQPASVASRASVASYYLSFIHESKSWLSPFGCSYYYVHNNTIHRTI